MELQHNSTEKYAYITCTLCVITDFSVTVLENDSRSFYPSLSSVMKFSFTWPHMTHVEPVSYYPQNSCPIWLLYLTI